MRTYCVVGHMSSRSGPLVVGCTGYNVVCGLFRSTYLVYRIFRPVSYISPSSAYEWLCVRNILLFGELEFSLNLFEVVLCVVPLYEFG